MIRRLESIAAASMRLAAILRKELQYENIKEHFRTDSQVVLGYINNAEGRFHIFVANSPANPLQEPARTMAQYFQRAQPSWLCSTGSKCGKYEEVWYDPIFFREVKYAISEIDFPEITNDDTEVKEARVLDLHVTMQLITHPF